VGTKLSPAQTWRGSLSPRGKETPSAVFLKFDLLAELVPYIDSADISMDEQVDGASTTYITVIYDMQGLPDLALDSSTGKGRFDIWVGKDNKYIYKLGFSTLSTDRPLVFSYYSRFNVPIAPPIVAPALPRPVQP
jgi:hypothetical protein